RREPHAPDARHAPDVIEQRCEVPGRLRRVPITVYVLPQQLDLAITHFSKLPGFGDHRSTGAASLRAAREGHHAVRAGLVAALDDRNVGPMRIVPTRE